MRKVALIFSTLAIAIFSSLFLYTWYRLHTALTLHIPAASVNLPSDLQPDTQFVKNASGQKIAYWYFPVENAKAVVILVHGLKNPGGKALSTFHVGYLRDAGYSTVLVDLQSNGESEGSKVQMGTTEWKDLVAIYDHVKSLPENQNKKIGFFGLSMGASTSLVTVGEKQKGDFIIASVPYQNLETLFRKQIQENGFPPMIFLPLMKLAAKIELPHNYENFTPKAVIKNIRVPVLFLAAQHDQQVSPEDPKELYHLANEPKELWEADSKHDIFSAQPEEFKKRVLEFLEKYANTK